MLDKRQVKTRIKEYNNTKPAAQMLVFLLDCLRFSKLLEILVIY